MKIFKSLLLMGFLLAGLNGFAQIEEKYDPHVKGKNDTIPVALTVTADGTFIPWLPVNEVVIKGGRARTAAERAADMLLERRVKKVYPYAVFAKGRYSKLEMDLAITGNKKQQKKLIESCNNEIKKMFSDKIKNMTITEGDILIKLIDRETGKSSYEMVRQLKSGMMAWSYQLIGKMYGHDLKEKYDPQQDYAIEAIVQRLEYRYN